ncbi:hypothetical protein OC842_007798, partial [Tilletia horrida]
KQDDERKVAVNLIHKLAVCLEQQPLIRQTNKSVNIHIEQTCVYITTWNWRPQKFERVRPARRSSLTAWRSSRAWVMRLRAQAW